MNKDDTEVPLSLDDRPARWGGYIVIFLVFVVFGGWAVYAPIDGAAIAPGSVVVKGYKKTVQTLEGGTITELLVDEGDAVTAGQLLMVLDSQDAGTNYDVLASRRIDALTQIARFRAEREQARRLSAPDDYDAQNSVWHDAWQEQTRLFEQRVEQYRGEVAVLKAQGSQLRSRINGYAELNRSRAAQKQSLDDEIANLRELVRQGYADRNRLGEFERRLDTLNGEIAQTKAAIASDRLAIGELQIQQQQLEHQWRNQAQEGLAQLQAQVVELDEQIAAAQRQVGRSQVHAPVAGVVLQLQVTTVGGIVQPGQVLMEIVPSGGDLIVEAQVSPVDIDRVFQGLSAEVRFPAFNSATTPKIEGTVVDLSADVISNPETGVGYYRARVAVSEAERKKLGDLKLVAGMPSDVLIRTGERTLWEYLTKPISNAFDKSLREDQS